MTTGEFDPDLPVPWQDVAEFTKNTSIPAGVVDVYIFVNNEEQLLAIDAIAANPTPGIDTTAIHVNQANEINPIATKATPVAADVVIIEDSENLWNKAKLPLSEVGFNSLHVDVAAEIHNIPQKTVPVSADKIVMEDSADAWNKKSMTLTTLLAAGGETNTASNVGGAVGAFKQKTLVDLEFNTFASGQFSLVSDVILISAEAITETELALASVTTGILQDNSVTNGKMAAMAANTIKGSVAGGNPQDLTPTEAATIIGLDDAIQIDTADQYFGAPNVTNPAPTDRILIETTAGGLIKGWTTVADIASGGAGEINTATNIGGGAIEIAVEVNSGALIPFKTLSSQFTEAANIISIDEATLSIRNYDGSTVANDAALQAIVDARDGERVKVTTNRAWHSWNGTVWEPEDELIEASAAEWAAITEQFTGETVSITDGGSKGLIQHWNGTSWEAMPPVHTGSGTAPAATFATIGAIVAATNLRDGSTYNVLGYTASYDGGGGTFTFVGSGAETPDAGTILDVTSGGQIKRNFDSGDIYAAWFGLTSSGDQTAAIQAALDYAFAVGGAGNTSKVRFGIGTFEHGPLTTGNGVMIVGEQGTIGTTLRFVPTIADQVGINFDTSAGAGKDSYSGLADCYLLSSVDSLNYTFAKVTLGSRTRMNGVKIEYTGAVSRDIVGVELAGQEQIRIYDCDLIAPVPMRVTGNLDSCNWHNMFWHCNVAPLLLDRAAVLVDDDVKVSDCTFSGFNVAVETDNFVKWDYDGVAGVANGFAIDHLRTEQSVTTGSYQIQLGGAGSIRSVTMGRLSFGGSPNGIYMRNVSEATVAGWRYQGGTTLFDIDETVNLVVDVQPSALGGISATLGAAGIVDPLANLDRQEADSRKWQANIPTGVTTLTVLPSINKYQFVNSGATTLAGITYGGRYGNLIGLNKTIQIQSAFGNETLQHGGTGNGQFNLANGADAVMPVRGIITLTKVNNFWTEISRSWDTEPTSFATMNDLLNATGLVDEGVYTTRGFNAVEDGGGGTWIYDLAGGGTPDADRILDSLVLPGQLLRQDNLSFGIVTPVSNVVPLTVGQEYLDTVLGLWWKSSGLTNADWKQLNS